MAIHPESIPPPPIKTTSQSAAVASMTLISFPLAAAVINRLLIGLSSGWWVWIRGSQESHQVVLIRQQPYKHFLILQRHRVCPDTFLNFSVYAFSLVHRRCTGEDSSSDQINARLLLMDHCNWLYSPAGDAHLIWSRSSEFMVKKRTLSFHIFFFLFEVSPNREIYFWFQETKNISVLFHISFLRLFSGVLVTKSQQFIDLFQI